MWTDAATSASYADRLIFVRRTGRVRIAFDLDDTLVTASGAFETEPRESRVLGWLVSQRLRSGTGVLLRELSSAVMNCGSTRHPFAHPGDSPALLDVRCACRWDRQPNSSRPRGRGAFRRAATQQVPPSLRH